MNLSAQVLSAFVKKKRTLALAESCTGGALAASLVAEPDASLYFLGSLVSYANSAKRDLLHVSPHTLKEEGAVSQSCALQMAQGAKRAFKADVALSVTGIAGPTGESKKKPVGTVFFALVSNAKDPHTWSQQFTGTRKQVINQACLEALKNLLNYV